MPAPQTNCFYQQSKRMIRRKKKSKLSWGHRKTRERNRMIAALDADCRQRIVWDRDKNVCQQCGKTEGQRHEDGTPVQVQWSHIVSRAVTSLRWESENCLAHCSKCHCWFTNNHTAGIAWFEDKFPERWAFLKTQMQANLKYGDTQIRELYEQLGS